MMNRMGESCFGGMILRLAFRARSTPLRMTVFVGCLFVWRAACRFYHCPPRIVILSITERERSDKRRIFRNMMNRMGKSELHRGRFSVFLKRPVFQER